MGISKSSYTLYHGKHTRNHTIIFCGVPATTTGGKPTHGYLTEVNSYLNACSASVHSKLGNGVVSYLDITSQPAYLLWHALILLSRRQIQEPISSYQIHLPHLPSSESLHVRMLNISKYLTSTTTSRNHLKNQFLKLFPKRTIVPSIFP